MLLIHDFFPHRMLFDGGSFDETVLSSPPRRNLEIIIENRVTEVLSEPVGEPHVEMVCDEVAGVLTTNPNMI